jgi:hypothetical protein
VAGEFRAEGQDRVGRMIVAAASETPSGHGAGRHRTRRVKLCRELIAVTRTTLAHLQAAAALMPTGGGLAA